MEDPNDGQSNDPDKKRGLNFASLRAAARANVQKVLAGSDGRITAGRVAGAGAVVALLLVGAVWAWLFLGLPNVPNAEGLWALNRRPGITFIDLKGEVVGTRGPYYGHGVKLEELPPYVRLAFLAIEDQRFYEHGAVDRQAIVRAAAANVMHGRTVQGGSTITQQLCKNLFLTPEQSLRRKLQEMILAGRVERKLTKDEVLELYLNRIFFGQNAYGVDAASRRYFGIPATQLSLAQAALLAGLPKAPSANDPSQYFDRAKARQRVVLASMVEAKFITPADMEKAWNEKIVMAKGDSVDSNLGYAFDMAADQARKLAGETAPDMVVRITVDRDLQDAAMKAVRANLPAPGKGKAPMQAALVSMDENGAIRALIGGRSYEDSKFNRATQAKRQPGSAFKTFVYATAFEEGLSPDTVRYDEPITINGWTPKNYDNRSDGEAMSLRAAFAHSINTIAASVAHEVGEAKIVALAHRFGIQSDLPAVPSIALGSAEVTPLEITQAYAAFMRDGRRADPYLIQSVEDSRGNVVYERAAYDAPRVYHPQLNKQMVSMMGQVVQAGTGTGARLDRDVAGKTGTSTDWRDAWFVGFTADYTTGVWVGFDDNSAMNKVSGAGLPTTIWREYMSVASKGLPARRLPGYDIAPRSEGDFRFANFYDLLAAAFGFRHHRGDNDDEDQGDGGGDWPQ